MKEFAEILVNEKIWTYSVPEHLQNVVQVGQKVLVNLRKKEKEGFIIRFVEKPQFETLPILKIVDEKQFFDETSVQLCQWVADTYKCFLETALKSILPR